MIKLAGHEVFLVGRGGILAGGIIIFLALVGVIVVLNWTAAQQGGVLLAIVLFLALLGGVKRLMRKFHF